jgi:amino acid adenylation domain-containing protein
MHGKEIETFYPLSPTQQGILFHALSNPGSSAYFGQLSLSFTNGFNPAAFTAAWERLTQRHAVLRTFFLWEELKEPIQVVHKEVKCAFEHHDWSDVPESRRQAALDDFLEQDSRRGLSLAKAPVMRLTLIDTGANKYRFIWSHHHILMDGWSASLILHELLVLYSGFNAGTEAILPYPRPYRDYIVWLGKQDIAKAQQYWSDLLAGFVSPTTLALPTLREQITDRDDSGQENSWEEVLEVSPQLLHRLRETGRKWRLTLNTLVQGAWAILLARYSDQSDIVYGVTVSGRSPELDGVEQMIGLFINTLPMRIRVNESEQLASFLENLQKQQIEMQEYEYSPLLHVQRWSEVDGSTPLFDHIFVFENYPGRDVASRAGLPKMGDFLFRQKTNYSVTLAVGAGQSLVLRALYDNHKYSARTAKRLLQHTVNLLETIAEDPRRTVSDAVMLSDAEIRQVLQECSNVKHGENNNQNKKHDGHDNNVVALFREQVKQNGHRPAVVSSGEMLTYEELDRRSSQLAAHLRELGVGPEKVVGLLLDRTPVMIESVLAVLKSGGAYLPLEASLPDGRLQYMLESSEACLVMTQEQHRSRVEPYVPRTFLVDREWPELSEVKQQEPTCTLDESNMAYVIYTSGSAGAPKGVVVQHGSLCNMVLAQIEAFGINCDTQLLQFASLSFDASVSEIFTALAAGATLHLATRAELQPGVDLMECLRERKISVGTFPPSILAVLSDAGLNELKTVVAAGESCSGEIVSRWAPGRRFINAYGPTESTVCASMSQPLTAGQAAVIGRPLRNGHIFILDSKMRPVPQGVAGELYIGGTLLARGYLKCPDLTAERFVPDPFSGQAGARMYRTGDRGCYCEDGNIAYIGRIDSQLKIRGFRIEPGEIEHALEQHSRVLKSLVLAWEQAPGERVLVAYFVPSGDSPGARELRDIVKKNLPSYMIPSRFIPVDSFPLTRNGKIDVSALPEPGTQMPEHNSDLIAPSNEIETNIAAIWSAALRLERIGVDENFFDLGGHSLLLMQVHDALSQKFKKPITMVEMFNHPTIRLLAAYYLQGSQSNSAPLHDVQERGSRRRRALSGQAR